MVDRDADYVDGNHIAVTLNCSQYTIHREVDYNSDFYIDA